MTWSVYNVGVDIKAGTPTRAVGGAGRVGGRIGGRIGRLWKGVEGQGIGRGRGEMFGLVVWLLGVVVFCG